MSEEGGHIAIIGMAGRFPGASNIAEFWSNLCAGKETIDFFDETEVRECGVDAGWLQNPNYVRAGGVLENAESFDAELFGFSPREAALSDPQHRVLLECGWEALEDAGYDPRRYDGLIGVFVGARPSSYLVNNLICSRYWLDNESKDEAQFENYSGFSATRLSFKLRLNGPSMFVQTACSTSLVAVHLACQELFNFECDMALAGGVSVQVPQKKGYLYQPEGILSPTGHCRVFDADSAGTVFSNGAGLVVLKRLEDALQDGDHIEAVILGSAINNDGNRKLSFTAPSAQGQADVISMAQAVSGVVPDQIGLVEAHGTGTLLGDPIEVSALSKVFGSSQSATCALGSIKANIGHLDAAAGIASLMKAVKAVGEGIIPPVVNYDKPNPELRLDQSPFFINTEITEWPVDGGERIAGVSSFGMGGTNAHLVLSQPPVAVNRAKEAGSGPAIVVLSANSPAALANIEKNLVNHASETNDAVHDIAFTLQNGRTELKHRRGFVCRDIDDFKSILEGNGADAVVEGSANSALSNTVFLFPGQGTQYPGMGEGLYRHFPVFREVFDECAEHLIPYLGRDIRQLLIPADRNVEQLAEEAGQTETTQPLLFAFEYALAKTWMNLGIKPASMIGHSIGEYVAACVAGVLSLKDALRIVVLRGELVQSLPGGSMLAVTLSPEQARAKTNEQVELAAINAPELCVLSGENEAIAQVEESLTADGIGCRKLHTSHAFHSFMLDPILKRFRAAIAEIQLDTPTIPFVSNVSGKWITEEQATNPDYWVQHLRQTVCFSAGIECLLEKQGALLIEVGPGNSLCTFSRQHSLIEPYEAIQSVRHPREKVDDVEYFYRSVLKAWTSGASLDWMSLPGARDCRRVQLPTYPFQRSRFWVNPDQAALAPKSEGKVLDTSQWLYEMSWRRVSVIQRRNMKSEMTTTRLLLAHAGPASEQLASRLSVSVDKLVCVYTADQFQSCDEYLRINPNCAEDYARMLEVVSPETDRLEIIHGLQLTAATECENKEERNALCFSLVQLVKVLSDCSYQGEIIINVATKGGESVIGGETLLPDAALLAGINKVTGQEYPNWFTRNIDFSVTEINADSTGWVTTLVKDLDDDIDHRELCYRSGYRWQPDFSRLDVDCLDQTGLRHRGVYLITGGLGNIGLAIAGFLAGKFAARLVLLGRSETPPREEWERIAEGNRLPEWSDRIRQLLVLEESGSEVQLISCNVADLHEMQQALSDAESRFGKVNGVIHAAGMVDQSIFKPLAQIREDDLSGQFEPKVDAVQILEQVLEGRDIDFCMLVSSLASQLGGLGASIYCSANRFLDCYANMMRQQGKPWISVDWDTWKFTDDSGQSASGKGTLEQYNLTRSEGLEVLENVFAVESSPMNICVSVGNLAQRYESWVLAREEKSDAGTEQITSVSSVSPEATGENSEPPVTADQIVLAEIWQELLGVVKIGIHDNFFELGGDSLKALRLTSRVRQKTGVDLSSNELFNAPTIAELAKLVTKVEAPVENPELSREEQLRAKIEQMSPEQVRALLDRKRKGN